MGKKTAISGVIVIAFAIFVGIGIAYESTTGLNMITGEKKTSGVGADKWTQTSEPIQQQVPAPGFEDVPEMIVESENNCDPSYPDVCIPHFPP